VNRTVTLSDGSVWTFEAHTFANDVWIDENGHPSRIPFLRFGAQLTASDHRKIADVLDPPASAGRTDTERLDWVQQNAVSVWANLEDDADAAWSVNGPSTRPASGESVRAAIDAARTPTPAEPSK
jgi:hypothetical protein